MPICAWPVYKQVEISVVIPCYRSARTLGSLIVRLHEALREHRIEILLVDDASPDTTWQQIQALAMRYPAVQGVRLQRNAGQQHAVACGLALASGDWIVTMDDDLQHPPEEIRRMLAAVQADPELDCVIGNYRTRDNMQFRHAGPIIVGSIGRLLYRRPKNVRAASFRLLHRDLAQKIVRHPGLRLPVGLLAFRYAYKVTNVAVEHHARASDGKSRYGLGKLMKTTWDMVLGRVPCRRPRQHYQVAQCIGTGLQEVPRAV